MAIYAKNTFFIEICAVFLEKCALKLKIKTLQILRTCRVVILLSYKLLNSRVSYQF